MPRVTMKASYQEKVMRENEKAHHMSVLKQQAYDTAMERIRDKVCDLVNIIRRDLFFNFFYSILLSLSLSLPHTSRHITYFCPPFTSSPLSVPIFSNTLLLSTFLSRPSLPVSYKLTVNYKHSITYTYVRLLTYNRTYEHTYS
jgi:hypothetical protein